MTDSINHASRPSLQGLLVEPKTPQDRALAVEQAFDYRGDITLVTATGQTLEGFLFDRDASSPEPSFRLWIKDSPDKIRIPYSQIVSLSFSGKDTAQGKSWETWVKKWMEKKARGEAATIETDSDE